MNILHGVYTVIIFITRTTPFFISLQKCGLTACIALCERPDG